MNKLYDTYKDRVAFLIVYLQEAHPEDAMYLYPGKGAEKDGFEKGRYLKGYQGITQAKTYEEREKVAKSCQAGLQLRVPFVIDTIDNLVDNQYAGWPDRIYIVTQDGFIHYKGEIGPVGFKLDEAEASLKQLLQAK